MSYQDSLDNLSIAISISESPDMAVLGLGEEHLRDAMAEVARHLMTLGAQLVYGGDLRALGFTELLFELVARHGRGNDGQRVGIVNYLAWPVHLLWPAEKIKQLSEDLFGVARIVCLDEHGQVMPLEERFKLPPRSLTDQEWADALTVMRQTMTGATYARIVLGGRVSKYKGRMPGVAEEVLVALQARQPLFLLGGFGGCARDIATDIRLLPASPLSQIAWQGRAEFAGLDVHQLNNGLTPEENAELARTVHIDQAIALILRGLLRLNRGQGAGQSPAGI